MISVDEFNSKMSNLTMLPKNFISKLDVIKIMLIADIIYDMKLTNQRDEIIDIGIGTLAVNIANNTYKFKFSPSAKLIEQLKNMDVSKDNIKSELLKTLEVNLSDKMTKLYKEFI